MTERGWPTVTPTCTTQTRFLADDPEIMREITRIVVRTAHDLAAHVGRDLDADDLDAVRGDTLADLAEAAASGPIPDRCRLVRLSVRVDDPAQVRAYLDRRRVAPALEFARVAHQYRLTTREVVCHVAVTVPCEVRAVTTVAQVRRLIARGEAYTSEDGGRRLAEMNRLLRIPGTSAVVKGGDRTALRYTRRGGRAVSVTAHQTFYSLVKWLALRATKQLVGRREWTPLLNSATEVSGPNDETVYDDGILLVPGPDLTWAEILSRYEEVAAHEVSHRAIERYADLRGAGRDVRRRWHIVYDRLLGGYTCAEIAQQVRRTARLIRSDRKALRGALGAIAERVA